MHRLPATFAERSSPASPVVQVCLCHSGVFERRLADLHVDGTGTAIVETESARLFTDGRYFLQAGQQLDSNWTLMKHGEKGVL